MKRIFLTCFCIVFALSLLSAQNLNDLKSLKKKKDKETTTDNTSGGGGGSVNVAPDANQFDMFDAWWNAGTKVFLTETSAHLDKFSKPQNVDKNQIFTEILKNESGKTKGFKLGSFGTFKIVGGNVYPLYFQGEGSKTLYFIGDYAIYIERSQSTSNEPNNNQIGYSSGNVFVFSFNKDLLNGLKLEKVQKTITDYLTAAQPKVMEARKKYKEEQAANLSKSPKVFECSGVKMDIVGTKICEYIDSYDNLKREVYVSIIDSVIVYQLVRSKADGKLGMLKRWDVPINIINANDRYFMTHFFMNDGEKIYKAMFPIISGFEYIYWQMLCDGNQYGKFEPELVRTNQKLEVTFNDEADAKEFFEEVKKIRAVVKTPEANSGTSSKSNISNSSARVAFFNDSGADMEIWIGSSKKTIHKNEHWSPTTFKVGDKVHKGNPGSSVRGPVILTISADMDGKVYYLGSGKLK